MSEKKINYKEPDDYFPKDIRKKMKIGEFAEQPKKEEKGNKISNEEFRNYLNGK